MTAKPAYLITDRAGALFACVVLDADLAELTYFEQTDMGAATLTVQQLEAAGPLTRLDWRDVETFAKVVPGLAGAKVRPTRPLVAVRAIATIARNIRTLTTIGAERKKAGR